MPIAHANGRIKFENTHELVLRAAILGPTYSAVVASNAGLNCSYRYLGGILRVRKSNFVGVYTEAVLPRTLKPAHARMHIFVQRLTVIISTGSTLAVVLPIHGMREGLLSEQFSREDSFTLSIPVTVLLIHHPIQPCCSKKST